MSLHSEYVLCSIALHYCMSWIVFLVIYLYLDKQMKLKDKCGRGEYNYSLNIIIMRVTITVLSLIFGFRGGGEGSPQLLRGTAEFMQSGQLLFFIIGYPPFPLPFAFILICFLSPGSVHAHLYIKHVHFIILLGPWETMLVGGSFHFTSPHLIYVKQGFFTMQFKALRSEPNDVVLWIFLLHLCLTKTLGYFYIYRHVNAITWET